MRRQTMRCFPILTIAVALATTLPAMADNYEIVGTVIVSDINGTLPGEPTINAGAKWFGSLTTDGVCQFCTGAWGAGLTGLEMKIFGSLEDLGSDDIGPSNVLFDRASLNL